MTKWTLCTPENIKVGDAVRLKGGGWEEYTVNYVFQGGECNSGCHFTIVYADVESVKDTCYFEKRHNDPER